MTESFEFNENDGNKIFHDVTLEIQAFGNFLQNLAINVRTDRV